METWKKTRRAFTLLEMLVALALMSIIAGSLYASLHIGFRAQQSAQSSIEPVRRAHFALELLRADLQAVLPPVGILAGEFVGENLVDDNVRDADSLLLHTASSVPPATTSAYGIRKIQLALSSYPDEPEPVLVRRITTQMLAPETPEPVEEVLCRGVVGLNLRYFDGTDWLDVWDSTTRDNTLPTAVEVTIEVKRKSDRQDGGAGYRLSRIFTLPCSNAGSEQEGAASQPSP